MNAKMSWVAVALLSSVAFAPQWARADEMEAQRGARPTLKSRLFTEGPKSENA